jgi:hypothetical protein
MLAIVLTSAVSFAMMFVSAAIPPGTGLPVMVGSTLNAKNAKPGAKIEGKVMQDIVVTNEWTIKRGSRVTGHVVRAGKAGPALTLTLKFDQLEGQGQPVPLNVSLRALASMMSVGNARNPINVASDFTSQNDWVTRQVGDDVVNRGRGLVGAPGGTIVGRWTGDGVYGKFRSPLTGTCPGDRSDVMQALWVFSTSACGAYDLPGASIVQDGSSGSQGEIVLKFEKDSKIGGGSGWMLVVNGNPSPTPTPR